MIFFWQVDIMTWQVDKMTTIEINIICKLTKRKFIRSCSLDNVSNCVTINVLSGTHPFERETRGADETKQQPYCYLCQHCVLWRVWRKTKKWCILYTWMTYPMLIGAWFQIIHTDMITGNVHVLILTSQW